MPRRFGDGGVASAYLRMSHAKSQTASGPQRSCAVRNALKVAATWSLCGLVWLLWSRPAGEAALTAYVEAVGFSGMAAIFGAFLLVVAFYCRTIERCLSLVEAEHRTVDPASAWRMFLLPYNFVEDFFIVGNVARSLRREASSNPRLRDFRSFGIWSGTGWCTAQIASLVPGPVGEAAGLLGGLLWAWHWHFIARMNRLLALSRAEDGPTHLEQLRASA